MFITDVYCRDATNYSCVHLFTETNTMGRDFSRLLIDIYIMYKKFFD